MVIRGSYISGADRVPRPTLQLQVQAAGSQAVAAPFLLDSGADRTVLCADVFALLKLPSQSAQGTIYQGIGGVSSIVWVTTALQLPRADGGIAIVRGQFAAFLDPQATDLSILGRDVLDHFDVLLSRQRNEVVLASPPHRCDVTQS